MSNVSKTNEVDDPLNVSLDENMFEGPPPDVKPEVLVDNEGRPTGTMRL